MSTLGAKSTPAWHDFTMSETVDPAASKAPEVSVPATRRRGIGTGELSLTDEPVRHATRPTNIAIVGVRIVGRSFAYSPLLSGLAAEIVLSDANHERAEGEAMDLN
jgi:lactate/malate dehydrogenase, NAD binding domain